MKSRLKTLLNVRSGEARLVLLLGLLLMGNSMALAISNVVSVSGFLSEVGVNELLIVWIVDMLLVILATGLQSLVVDRFNRVSLLRWMSFVFALFYVLLRLLFVFGVPGWINYSLLFLLTEQQWLFFPLIFWILANDIFDMAQTKRLFPLIASGSFTGQIIGLGIAAAAPGLLSRANIPTNELLSLNVILYLLVYLMISEGLHQIKVRQTPHQPEAVREALTEGWGFVKDVPSFRYLTLAMIMVTVSFTIVEFHFLSVASTDSAFSDADSFQTFYSLYNLAATVVAITIQTFLTSRIINKINLKNTFFIYPASLLGSAALILAFPTSVASVVTGVGLPRLSRGTVDETARKTFQALVPEERRGRVSMFMDSYLFAVGAIIGSLILGAIILSGKIFDLDHTYYIYLAISLWAAVVTLLLIFRMRSVYDASLLNWRLKRRQRSAGVLDKLDF
jgi:AAA family ATP:ADP antiporter